jgi:hypothetical protein
MAAQSASCPTVQLCIDLLLTAQINQPQINKELK